MTSQPEDPLSAMERQRREYERLPKSSRQRLVMQHGTRQVSTKPNTESIIRACPSLSRVIELYHRTLRISTDQALTHSLEAALVRCSASSSLSEHEPGNSFSRYFTDINAKSQALVAAGSTSTATVNHAFYLMEMRYQDASVYQLPGGAPTACGTTGFSAIPRCSTLVVRVSYFSESDVLIAHSKAPVSAIT